MKTVKLLIEFGFWSFVVIGLIIFNIPNIVMEIVKDWRKKKHAMS